MISTTILETGRGSTLAAAVLAGLLFGTSADVKAQEDSDAEGSSPLACQVQDSAGNCLDNVSVSNPPDNCQPNVEDSDAEGTIVTCDEVDDVMAVPEPGVLPLLAIGLVAGWLVRRRKRS